MDKEVDYDFKVESVRDRGFIEVKVVEFEKNNTNENELKSIETLNDENVLELPTIELNKNISNKSNKSKKDDYMKLDIKNIFKPDKENSISLSRTDSKRFNEISTQDKEAVLDYNNLLFKLTQAGFNNIKIIQNCFRLYRKLPLEEIISKITVNDEGKYDHNFIEKPKHSKNSIKPFDLCDLCEQTNEHHVKSNYEIVNVKIDLEKRKKTTEKFLKNINSKGNSILTSRKSSILSISHNNKPIGENLVLITQEFDDSYNKEDKICLICELIIPTEDIKPYTLLICKHFYCEECLHSYLKEEILNSRVKAIKCPSRDNCKYIFDRDKLKQIFEHENKDLLIKYDKFTEREKILINKNHKLCPVSDCEGYSSIEGIDIEKNENLKLICNNEHAFCVRCMEPWHEGKSCQDYQNTAIIQVCSSLKIKRCFKCNTFTQKNEGCNHMTCVVCKGEWCWLCGKEHFEGHFNRRDNPECYHKQFWDPDDPNGMIYGPEPAPPIPQPRYDHDATDCENLVQYMELFLSTPRPQPDAECCEKFGKLVCNILFPFLILIFNCIGNMFHGIIMHKGINYLEHNNVFRHEYNQCLYSLIKMFYYTSCAIMWVMGFFNFLGTAIIAFVFSIFNSCIVACCRA